MPDPPALSPVGRLSLPSDLTIELADCLVLTAPAWFAREDFRDWRQGRAEGQWTAPACWLPQDRSGDYTDVFLTFDCSWPPQSGPGTEFYWEGSDADTRPFDIYEAVGKILHEHGLSKGVLWLKPL